MIRLHLGFLAVLFLFINVVAHADNKQRDIERQAFALYDMVYQCIKGGGSYDRCRAYVATAVRQIKEHQR